MTTLGGLTIAVSQEVTTGAQTCKPPLRILPESVAIKRFRFD